MPLWLQCLDQSKRIPFKNVTLETQLSCKRQSLPSCQCFNLISLVRLRNFFWTRRQNSSLRASALKNATLSYFTIPKSYFINYIILFYNTPYIQKLYYFTFSLKYYFFNLFLLFLSHHHFVSAKGWNKIYIYIIF